MKFLKVMLSSRIFTALFTLCFLCIWETECAKHFKLGAIFDEDDYESQMAFRYGVDRINMHSHKIKFDPIIKVIRGSDSFHAGKIACELLEENVIAIFGPDSEDSRGIVESISETFEIPHVESVWLGEPVQYSIDSMSINFYPSSQIVAEALAGLIQDYDWKSYAILYEDEEGLVRLSEILKRHGPDGSPITARQLEPGGDNRSIFKAIKNASETRIILDCKPENILGYFREANEVNLMGDYQVYITASYVLTNLDSHIADLGEYRYARANITSMRMLDPKSPTVRNAVSDWEEGEKIKDRSDHIIIRPEKVKLRSALMNDAVRHFASSVIDLDKTHNITEPSVSCESTIRWEHGLPITSFMKIKTTLGMTGVVNFTDQKRKEFSLDILELGKDGFNKIGSWDHSGVSYSRPEGDVSVIIAEKWQNKTFIVTSRLGAPYLMKRTPKDGEILVGNARYEGYSMDLIDEIAKYLNITYEFRLVPDENYGSYDKKTKKWNGLVLELLENRADLAICDLTITSERKSAVDFTMPFMTLGISILFTKPVKKPPELFSFLSPLSVDVWIYMATAYLGVSLLLFVLSRIEPENWENPRPGDDNPTVLVNVWKLLNTFWFSAGSLMGAGCDILPKLAPKEWANPHPCVSDPEELENALNILNSMWFSMGSFLQQGSDILPRAVSTRIVAGMWWFFTLIMISSYTANLAAFLTNAAMDAAIESAEDLAKQSKVKYGVMKGGSTSNFFKDSNFSTYKLMWTVMESTRPSVFVKNNDEGIERVLKGKNLYAFFMESTSIEYVTAKNCDLTQIGNKLDSKGYGIAMPPNSPYRTAISGAVLQLQEKGELNRLKTKWWKEKNGGGVCKEDDKKADSSAQELGLDNVGGVFVVLGGGCGMAFLVAIAEFLWNVRAVAVEGKIRYKEAFLAELKFATNIWITSKPVHNKLSESHSSHSSRSSSKGREPSEARSSAGNMLQAATSFMRLDKVF